jgi:nucleoside-diphosphate-sugar epimerase
MYGITKVAGELLGDYYVRRYGVDVRGCRFPGVISHETLPGGGTTDYAVAIFFEAVKNGRYTCFLREDTRLPMMYMPDCLKSVRPPAADFGRLAYANFNVTAMSHAPSWPPRSASTSRHSRSTTPDFRQAIADSWLASLDDSAARAEWGWRPDYNLARMTADMLAALAKRRDEGRLNY